MIVEDLKYEALAFALVDGVVVILIMCADSPPKKFEIPLEVLTEAVKELLFNVFKN